MGGLTGITSRPMPSPGNRPILRALVAIGNLVGPTWRSFEKSWVCEFEIEANQIQPYDQSSLGLKWEIPLTSFISLPNNSATASLCRFSQTLNVSMVAAE